jgi:hypothetical protein
MYIVPILAAARLYLRIPPDPRLVSPVPAGPTAPCGEHRRCHVDRVLRFALLGSRRSLLLSLHTQCDSLDPPPKLSVFYRLPGYRAIDAR